jgi:DNA-binding IclR family transcriptional regulator
VRRLGFAVAPGSVEAVSTGIAVPVRDHGSVVAALGVVLPREGADEQRAVGVLRAAAREIEETLTRSPSAFG